LEKGVAQWSEEEAGGLGSLLPSCGIVQIHIASKPAGLLLKAQAAPQAKRSQNYVNRSLTMAEAANVVRVSNVTKVFKLGKIEVQALKGVNLQIAKGDYISIMGPSGSGKSTLFNMIGGLDKPTSGKVFIDEVDIAQLDAYELAWLRCRKIGYIFQTFNIIQVMTALENVTLPMIFAGMHNDAAVEKGMQLLELVGLGDRFSHKPFELSGGQQQRVAVARALANDPAIILADEPTGNLDLTTGEEIIALLKRLSQERGVTVISATHDFKMLNVSDQVVWIRDGRVDKIEDREELSISIGQIGTRD
jgi:putative ABC transport system ATP-binding protein